MNIFKFHQLFQKFKEKKKVTKETCESSQDKYKNEFDNIVDIYIEEISNRFVKDELSLAVGLYTLLMIKDHEDHDKFDYKILIQYEKLINLERLKLEVSSYINYKKKFNKIDWNDQQKMINDFVENNLKNVYEEIYKVFKIYLTIPVSSSEAERAFSVLKLIKTWLRTATEDDRLSDLEVIKMGSNIKVNYDLIIEEFIKLKDRRLTLV